MCVFTRGMAGLKFIVCTCGNINGGSYMSAHVLFNLLNKLGKEMKCEAARFAEHFISFSHQV